MTEFAKPQNDLVHPAELTRPFDDNFFTSESLQFNSDLFASDRNSAAAEYAEASLLPETQPEESFPLREWRRQNVVRLVEKEKTEKELLKQILNEADEYRVEFLEKQQINCEKKKAINREKEKLFLIRKEKFDAEADKNYWKSIAELIPTETEVAGVERRGKKDKEKKPSIDVIQGPKPGRRTDLSRMRQILLKLKDDSPMHLKLYPPTGRVSSTDTAASDYEAVTSSDAVIVA